VSIGIIVRKDYPGDTCYCSCCFGDLSAGGASYQHIDIATDGGGGGYGVKAGCLQRFIIVFGNYKYGH
jgi:hypothetical protein